MLTPKASRIVRWGCLGAVVMVALSTSLALAGAAALWRARANQMAPAEVGDLAREEVHSHASEASGPVQIVSMELVQSAFGQTNFFQDNCQKLSSIVNYNRMYFEQVLSTNWCDPFQPVWEVSLTTEWPARRARQMNVYLIYSAEGRLLYSCVVVVP